MNRYRVKATVCKIYVAEEDVTFDAEDEEEARTIAHKDAKNHSDMDSFDAEHHDTDVHVQAVAFIGGENSDGTQTAIRCDKTPDMFQGEV